MLLSGLGTLLTPLLIAAAVSATPYRDDQGRFEVQLPPGWQYSPLTTNLAGAMFRSERAAGRFAEASVTVFTFNHLISADVFSARMLDSFSQEPGFSWRQQERPCQVAGHRGRCRSFFLSGPPGRKILRVVEQQLAVVDHVGYLAHCETQDVDFHAFKDDCAAIFSGLKLQADLLPAPRQRRAAPPLRPEDLVGGWQGGRHALHLSPGHIVDLDGQQGTWRMAPGVLVLTVDGHDSVYEVEHRPGRLTLRGGRFGDGQLFVAQPRPK